MQPGDGAPTNGRACWLPPPTNSFMSTSPAPSSPRLSSAPLCSFRLSRRSSWRVHAGLVSHSTVRPHQGAVVERIIAHPLYSAQSHDYDVALLQLRTPLHFSGEAVVRGVAQGMREPRGFLRPPCAVKPTFTSFGDRRGLWHHLDLGWRQLFYSLFWGQKFWPFSHLGCRWDLPRGPKKSFSVAPSPNRLLVPGPSWAIVNNS